MADEKPDSTEPGADAPEAKAKRPRRAPKSGAGEKARKPEEPAAKPRRAARRKPAAEPEAEAATAAKGEPEAASRTEAAAEPEAEAKPKRKARPKPSAAGSAKDEPAAKPEAAAEGEPEPEAAAEDGESAERATAPAPARARDTPAGPPVVRAQARYVRSSARKARLVCDHLRGKSVEEARAILSQADRAVARDWSKLLESAVANAEHNHDLDGDELRVLRVHADEGPTLKRFRPRAMGRATRIRKRTTHLAIELTPKEQR